MPARHRTLSRLAVTTILTLGLVAAGTTSSIAAPAAAGTTADRTEDLCTRADHLRARLEKALDRIQGDAGTQGSVAWLRARADRASATDHADLAASLRARADRREDRVPEIEDVLVRLASATAEHCAAASPSSL